MSKHTPGPWIARGESINAHRAHACGGYNEESVLSLTRSPEERRANARLIAAAPDLLAALQQIERLGIYADRTLVDVPAMLSAIASRAIANATGEQL